MAMADTVKQLKRSIGSSRPDSREMEFTFTAPNAKKVSIAGQFNNWDTQAMPMKKAKNGVWTIKLKLPLGKCEYKYFVDGSWVNDAACSEAVPNTYGTSNSVITVQ
ncbi:MAG: isoamylase early set domain-containing protein [Nitrospirota bacterium]